MGNNVTVNGANGETITGTVVSTDWGSQPTAIRQGTTTYIKNAFGDWVPDYTR